MLFVKFAYRDRREFDAHHLMTERSECDEIQALARKRHEYPSARRQSERRPMIFERRMRARHVKPDLVLRPTLVPERRFHARTGGQALELGRAAMAAYQRDRCC